VLVNTQYNVRLKSESSYLHVLIYCVVFAGGENGFTYLDSVDLPL